MGKYVHRFPPGYQKLVGINAREHLHKNSIELCDVLQEHDVIKDNIKIFEIGAGGCRNLKYIHDKNNTIQLFANDLYKEASVNQMHETIKEKVIFFEVETQKLFDEQNFTDLDLLVTSDHLMHIEKEAGEKILFQIKDNWKPEYVLIREIKKEYESLKHPRIWHNYSVLQENYEIIHEQDSAQDEKYFIILYKRLDE